MTCWLCGETTERVTTRPSCKNGPCKFCIAVADIDEEIKQAVAALRRLVAKRYDLLSQQNRAHDLLHRLPIELKSYIFQLVLPEKNKWGFFDRRVAKSNRIVPSYLTSICRNWRDVACSTPSLWSTIKIILEPASTSDPSWTQILHDLILRSQALPLTLQIVVDGVSEEEWRRVLDVVSPSSNRWHTLSLGVPLDLLRTSYNHDLQYDQLRRLQIAGPIPLFNPTMSPEDIVSSFEALRISWNHLTSVTVSRIASKEITQLFQHASRMTDCHITLCEKQDSYRMPRVIHRRLKSLALCQNDENTAVTILDSLTLPRLQEFCTEAIPVLSHLPALVRRSSCPLTTIRLSLYGFRPFFNSQPFLGVTDLVIDELYSNAQLLLEGEYFPDLRRLTLRLQPFLFLWGNGTIRSLLRIGSRLDASEEGPFQVIVVDRDCASELDVMWNSEVGKELEALNVILREDGFEILV